MTNFMKREKNLIAEFQKEMDGYGLKVDNGTSGMYGEGCYRLEMTTKIERAKGKKALIALLMENGYIVNKFMFTDRKTGERYMAFKVYKYATMENRDDDAEEYVEPQAQPVAKETKPENWGTNDGKEFVATVDEAQRNQEGQACLSQIFRKLHNGHRSSYRSVSVPDQQRNAASSPLLSGLLASGFPLKGRHNGVFDLLLGITFREEFANPLHGNFEILPLIRLRLG